MKTCILVANADEANYIQSVVKDKGNIEIVIIGEGRSHVIPSLSEAIKKGIFKDVDQIINIGYVGAYGYKKGDVVMVETVQHFYPSKTIAEPTINLKTFPFEGKCANCYTADNFVTMDDVDIQNACVVDMELYYVALMFPNVVSIKIVSDELNYNDYKEANFDESWEKVRNLIIERC